MIDAKHLAEWADKIIRNAQDSVMSKAISDTETQYERGKYAVAKELKREFKL